MKRPTPSILFVSQDAGGFQAIVPVYRRLLRSRRFLIAGIFGNVARSLPSAKGLSFVNPDVITVKAMERRIQRAKPDLIVCAPSAGFSLDKKALLVARAHGIPTLTVLDYCGNYDIFFSDPNTNNRAYLPDRICVMNAHCKREMVKEGFAGRRISVTGHPRFDTMRPFSPRKGTYALFVEQPFSELEKQQKGIGFGYDERDVFADVVSALEHIRFPQPLAIAWHPRTRHYEKFDRTIARTTLCVAGDNRLPTADLLHDASIIIGMNSTALLEASLCGKRVMSYQPSLNKPDPLVSNRWGVSTLVTSRSQLRSSLKRLLAAPSRGFSMRNRDRYVPRRATQNVIRVINSMV